MKQTPMTETLSHVGGLFGTLGFRSFVLVAVPAKAGADFDIRISDFLT